MHCEKIANSRIFEQIGLNVMMSSRIEKELEKINLRYILNSEDFVLDQDNFLKINQAIKLVKAQSVCYTTILITVLREQACQICRLQVIDNVFVNSQILRTRLLINETLLEKILEKHVTKLLKK